MDVYYDYMIDKKLLGKSQMKRNMEGLFGIEGNENI